MNQQKYQSKEAQFLFHVMDVEGIDEAFSSIKNPVLSVIAGQVKKLLVILDSNEGYQKRMAGILSRIKEDW